MDDQDQPYVIDFAMHGFNKGVRHRFATPLQRRFPLPPGEGWGEGSPGTTTPNADAHQFISLLAVT